MLFFVPSYLYWCVCVQSHDCTPHCIDFTDTDLTACVFFGSASFIIILLLLLAISIMYLLPFHDEIKIIVPVTAG